MASGMKTLCSVEKGQAAAGLLYGPLLDARRSDVYGALYTAAGDPLLEPSALTVDQDFLAAWRSEQLLLFGSGAAKAQKLAAGPPAWQFRPFTCHASWLAPLAEEAFQGGRFSDPAYFEPLYVKPFYSPAPKARS
jgi:tRNA threonylcarbamoyladenosine biosynthesis protein TsaB